MSMVFRSGSSAVTGTLQFSSNNAQSAIFNRNRAGYQIGDSAIVEYEIGHVNDIFMNFTVPTEIWLKDGMVVTQPRINMQMFNGRLTTMHSFTVTSTDAGLYQVVFTDTARSEIFITLPTRIDTGEMS